MDGVETGDAMVDGMGFRRADENGCVALLLKHLACIRCGCNDMCVGLDAANGCAE